MKEPSSGDVREVARVTSDAVVSLAKDTLSLGRQMIVFVNTKRGAESQAEKIASKTDEELEELSEQVLKVLSTPTKQCKRLAKCVRKGVAFHHSGLHSKQRGLIEDAFRDRVIKVICATPTLCLSPDTEVWEGVKSVPANKVKSSSRVIGLLENELTKVKVQDVQKSQARRLFKIKTVSGHYVKVTGNHRILAKIEGKKVLVEARKLTKKHKLATVGRLSVKIKSCTFGDFLKEYDLHFENRQLTENDFYFIGAMLGDGYSGAQILDGKLKMKGTPCIVGKDEEVFNQVKKFCKNSDIHYRRSLNYGGTPQLVLSKANWFREYLCRSGVDVGQKKHVADKLMQGSDIYVSALLKGLFDTDGYVQKGMNIGYSSISYELIRNIQKLLLRFGIITRLRKRKGKPLQITEKIYDTKDSYEILIHQNKSILDFYNKIGFSIQRKQKDLQELVDKIGSNILYSSCQECDYKIYKTLFGGRANDQRVWGYQKRKVIELLGKKKELGSNELSKILKFSPRKKSTRLNHHYQLIKKRKIGKLSSTEWFWSLNSIGSYVYKHIVSKEKSIDHFLKKERCPLCKNPLSKRLRENWRSTDFEKDIFWDRINEIKEEKVNTEVYDVVLPSNGKHEHLFVANGILVHNSAGINMPAFRVIIRDLKRYGGPWGMVSIPVLEYEQQAGRAGRPGNDPWGEAICVARDSLDADEIVEKYIHGEPEEIYSKLAVEPVLRTYILSLVASDFVKTKDQLFDFFSKTFYAHQYGDMDRLRRIIEMLIEKLDEWEFLKVVGESQGDFVSANELGGDVKLRATPLGKRVSDLYLDPYTAHHIIKGLKRSTNKTYTTFSLLHLLSSCLEMRPYLKVRQKELAMVEEKLIVEESSFLHLPPVRYSDEFDTYLDTLKTAMLFEEWIEEKNEEELLELFNVRPGELHGKLEVLDWLVYAGSEICRIVSFHKERGELLKLRTRLKHGAKEELLPLLKLRDVGRVRGRRMFRNGIRSILDLQRVDVVTLGELVGKKVAIKLKEQVGQKVEVVKENKRKGQKSVKDW